MDRIVDTKFAIFCPNGQIAGDGEHSVTSYNRRDLQVYLDDPQLRRALAATNGCTEFYIGKIQIVEVSDG